MFRLSDKAIDEDWSHQPLQESGKAESESTATRAKQEEFFIPSGKRLHNYGKIHHVKWENPL